MALLNIKSSNTVKLIIFLLIGVNYSTGSDSTSTDNIDGELNFTSRLSEQLENLYLNLNHSDVTFVIDGIRLPAHKVILNMRSSYFEPLTNSEASQSEIELKVPLEAFKHALRYIYTGRVSLRGMDYETAIDLLNLSKDFFLEELKSGLALHLMKNVTMKNCYSILEAAHFYELKELEADALDFMDQNAKQVLEEDEFKTLTSGSLYSLLARSSFVVPEIDIFKAVVEWRRRNPNVGEDDLQTITSAIRFELIDLTDLLSVVRDSSILSAERLLDAVQAKANTKTLNHRFISKNVASIELNAKVIKGEKPLELLNGNYTHYDSHNGYTSHTIPGSNGNCIIVDLENTSMLNKLEMLLWDLDNRSYFYYIEVSTDQEQWTRVIDHTVYNCRSWQNLYFKTQPVRYIKIVGTGNTANSGFHVVHLAAYHRKSTPTLIGGLISPVINVATIENGAKVITGICNTGNLDVVLNGNFTEDVSDKESIYHQLKQGSIIIQLAQPYHIGSLRLQLWDGNNRAYYSFYIETSTNQKDWKMAVDRRDKRLQSLQDFTFEARPVVFFKITGTSNSIGNDYFHLFHFEAPSTSITN